MTCSLWGLYSMSRSTSVLFASTTPQLYAVYSRKVDIRLPGTGDSNSHGARPVHLIISMIKWIRTGRLSIKKSLWEGLSHLFVVGVVLNVAVHERLVRLDHLSPRLQDYLAHKKPPNPLGPP